MKKNTFFLVLLLNIFFGNIHAQIQVGDGTINYYAPIDFRYDRSYSQVIYLGSEINGSGTITSLAWYYNNIFETIPNHNIDVYIGHTRKDNFTYTQQSGTKADYEPLSNLTKVYSGRLVTNSSKGWKTIILDTPFDYDGSSNLVVAVNSSFNGQIWPFSDPDRFYNTLHSGVRTLTTQTNGGAPYNPETPPSYASFSGNTPNIKFGGLSQSCETPKGLVVSNITTNSATITYDVPITTISGGSEYYVTTSNTLPDKNTIPTDNIIEGQNFDLTGLNGATYYNVYVRYNCGDGVVSAWSTGIKFITTCEPSTGFFEDVEGETITVSPFNTLPKCWSRILRGGDDLGPMANIGISNDPSQTIMHGKNSIAIGNGDSNVSILSKLDIILITPQLDNLDLTKYRLKFWTRSAYGAKIEIGTINNTDPETAAFNKFHTLTLPGNDPVKEHTLNLTSFISDDDYIAFRIASDFQYSGFFIDDITLELIPECPDVKKVTVQSTTTNAAFINWEDANNSGSYQVSYGLETATNPDLSTILNPTSLLTQEITGLNPNTNYKVWVRSICENNRNGVWIGPVTFTTLCTPISSILENFDAITTEALPTCWGSIIRGTSNADFAWVKTSNDNSNGNSSFSAPNSVQIYAAGTYSSSTDLILHTPQLDLSTLTDGKHRLVFYTKCGYPQPGAKLEIGTLNNQTKTAVFTPYLSYALSQNMTKYVAEFDNYSGTNNIIAFRVNNADANIGMVYIDDVKWELIPTCLEIDNTSVAAILPYSALINWEPNGLESDWQVVYSNDLTANPSELPIIDTKITSLQLNNLLDNTNYKVWIRAKCDASTFSSWSTPISFTTKCAPIASFNEDFKNVIAPNLPMCWSKILRGPTLSSFAFVKTNKYENQPIPGETTYSVSITNGSQPSVDNDIMLVSPNLNTLSLGTYRLRFTAKGDTTGQIEFGTVNTNDDTAVFTLVESIVPPKNFEEFIIDYSSYSGENTYIAIRTNNRSLSFIQITNIVWELTPLCPDTNNIVNNIATTDAATFTWDINGATLWQAVKGEISDNNPDDLTPINNIDVPYLELNGLSENTSYKTWVRADCGNGLYGKWSNPKVFKTQCYATNVPYFQDFESTTTPDLPSCTTEINKGPSVKTWVTAKFENWENNHGFTTKTLKYVEDGQNPANTWFFTQGINLEAGQDYTISYIYGGASTDEYFANDLKVMYGTEAIPESMNLPIADYQKFSLDGPVSESISFTAPTTDIYYFGFNAYSKRNSFWIFVDDIKIDTKTSLSTNAFDLSQLNYYPNPVKGILNINYIDNISSVSVYNLLGQEVITKSINQNVAKVDMSTLPKGTYLVKITANELVKTIKIVKE